MSKNLIATFLLIAIAFTGIGQNGKILKQKEIRDIKNFVKLEKLKNCIIIYGMVMKIKKEHEKKNLILLMLFIDKYVDQKVSEIVLD